MKKQITIIIFFWVGFISGQNSNNVKLAQEYYKNNDFEKALVLFEDIYQKRKSKQIYSQYKNCLIKTGYLKKAERIIKSFYKKTNDPTILIDLGDLYIELNEVKKANKQFELALRNAQETPRFLANTANRFYKSGNYEFALKNYELAKKNINKPTYGIQIANIYSQIGDMENMYRELIELIINFPNYYQTCKNKLRLTITENPANKNNEILKKLLIKQIQKNNSYESSKMLVWLFMQEKLFQKALDYEISIDKGIVDNKLDIISLGDITFANKDYTTASNAFNYVSKVSHKNSYYHEYCTIQLLEIELAIIQEKISWTNLEIKKLAEKYQKTINNLGIKSETILAVKNYAHILSHYLHDNTNAKVLLENAINNPTLTTYDSAICKMELAKILLKSDNIWEAILLYTQVEQDFKEDVIGQQAKFEKIKINYYNGDFDWAQTQLKVLKLSTSKLIANNAMKLSLLISDNLNLDTTSTALLLYAQSELCFEQKNYISALEKLNTLQTTFPKHSLIDEVLLKKSEILLQQEKQLEALSQLDAICANYYHDILYDDALFRQAKIYEEILHDYPKAKEKYELLLLKSPNSIFVNQARKQYRLLRNNNFLLMQ